MVMASLVAAVSRSLAWDAAVLRVLCNTGGPHPGVSEMTNSCRIASCRTSMLACMLFAMNILSACGIGWLSLGGGRGWEDGKVLMRAYGMSPGAGSSRARGPDALSSAV